MEAGFKELIGLGVLAGLASSLSIVALVKSIEYIVSLVGSLSGIGTGGTTDFSTIAPLLSRPVLFIVVMLSLPLGYTVARLLGSREAMGAGVEKYVKSYHMGAVGRELRHPVAKIASTALTLSLGGSGGLQGPSCFIGGSLSGYLAGKLGLRGFRSRVLSLAGVAAAVSTVFRAPLGAAILALEVPYKRDLETEALTPVLFASLTGFIISNLLLGGGWGFPRVGVELSSILSPVNILLYIFFSFYAAGVGFLFIAVLRGFEKLSSNLSRRLGELGVAVLYGVCLASIGLLIPYSLGTGMDQLVGIASSSLGEIGLYDILWFTLLLIAKMVTSSLTVTSGSSAGLFGPGIFIGGLAGVIFYIGVKDLVVGLGPEAFMYIGMAAVYGSMSTTPFGTSILIGEISGDYILLFPSMLASVIAREILGDYTLYRSQWRTRTKP